MAQRKQAKRRNAPVDARALDGPMELADLEQEDLEQEDHQLVLRHAVADEGAGRAVLSR